MTRPIFQEHIAFNQYFPLQQLQYFIQTYLSILKLYNMTNNIPAFYHMCLKNE